MANPVTTSEDMDALLLAAGIDPSRINHSMRQQMSIYVAALKKFADRNEEYEDLWKEGGTKDSLRHADHKLRRAERAKSLETRVDSAVDLINYAAFFVRNAEAEEGLIRG